jgi:hypothetical protein
MGWRGGGEAAADPYIEKTVGETPAEEERGDKDVREDCKVGGAGWAVSYVSVSEKGVNETYHSF